MHIRVICKYCNYLAKDDEVVMEINFQFETLYWVCPNCKKDNSIILHPNREPLPRARIIR